MFGCFQFVEVVLEMNRIYFLFEVFVHRSFAEGALPEASPFVHGGNNIRVIDEFNVSNLVARLQDPVQNHFHIHVFFHPHFIHDSEKLKH